MIEGQSETVVAEPRMTEYLETAVPLLAGLGRSQQPALTRAADVLAEAVREGRVIRTFGTGHSRVVALELSARAGGLIPVDMLAVKDLVLWGGRSPETIRDPLIERDPELAGPIWAAHDIQRGDPFVIASNSGRNGVVVEMALLAKDAGCPVVAVTSVAHASSVTSRHPSGLLLRDIADVTIDNLAPHGDTLLRLDDGSGFCAISNLTGVLIAQLLTAGVVDRLSRDGHPVAVYTSLNAAGQSDVDARLRGYGTRILPIEP